MPSYLLPFFFFFFFFTCEEKGRGQMPVVFRRERMHSEARGISTFPAGGLGCLLLNTLFFYSDLGYESPLLPPSLLPQQKRGAVFSVSELLSNYFLLPGSILTCGYGLTFPSSPLLSPPYVRYLSTCLTNFFVLFFFSVRVAFLSFGFHASLL